MRDPSEPLTNAEVVRMLRLAAGLTGDYVEPEPTYEGADDVPGRKSPWEVSTRPSKVGRPRKKPAALLGT